MDEARAAGAWVKSQRLAVGMTQEELSGRSGLSVRAISNLECGRTARPHPRSLEVLAVALGLPEAAGTAWATRVRADRAPGSSASSQGPRQLPAGIGYFTGRQAELDTISSLLDDTGGAGGTVVVSAIDGTAGIGKTALAVHWAHRHAGRFPDGQLYVNLRGFDPAGAPVDALTVVLDFLHALGVPAERIPANEAAQLALYRSILADRQMLIVLDNARDAEQVRPLLPGAEGCLVLVTSRTRLAGLVALDGAVPVTLGLLTEAESLDLLALRLGADRVGREQAAARELVELCARLPLALNIAAARAVLRPGRPLAELVSELRDAHQRLDVFTLGEAAADPRATFSLSYRALSPQAARMFRLLGAHPGRDISAAAAGSLAALDGDAADSTLTELTSAHLLTEHTPGRYALHDLLRAYAAEQLSDGERLDGLRRILGHYLRSAHAALRLLSPGSPSIELPPPDPGVTPETMAGEEEAAGWYATERMVLLAAVTHAADAGLDGYAWQISWAISQFLDINGHWQELVAVGEIALTAAERCGDRLAQASAHRSIGSALSSLGYFAKARNHAHQALAVYIELSDLVRQGHAHVAIGQTFEYEKLPENAIPHHLQALDLYEAADDSGGRAMAMNCIGWCHVLLGEYHQALKWCGQALDLVRKVSDRYGEAATLDSIGYAHHHLRDHGQAIACYQQALPLFRAIGDRYLEAGTLTRLGDTHEALGDHTAAREAWQAALLILSDLGHPDAAAVRTKLRKARAS